MKASVASSTMRLAASRSDALGSIVCALCSITSLTLSRFMMFTTSHYVNSVYKSSGILDSVESGVLKRSYAPYAFIRFHACRFSNATA